MTHTEALADRPVIHRSLAAAARRIPSFRDGKRTHPSTLTRWIIRGVHLTDGSTLKLEAKRFPGGWAVSDEAVDRFVDRLTADRCGEPAAAAIGPPTRASRRKAEKQANAEADRMGL